MIKKMLVVSFIGLLFLTISCTNLIEPVDIEGPKKDSQNTATIETQKVSLSVDTFISIVEGSRGSENGITTVEVAEALRSAWNEMSFSDKKALSNMQGTITINLDTEVEIEDSMEGSRSQSSSTEIEYLQRKGALTGYLKSVFGGKLVSDLPEMPVTDLVIEKASLCRYVSELAYIYILYNRSDLVIALAYLSNSNLNADKLSALVANLNQQGQTRGSGGDGNGDHYATKLVPGGRGLGDTLKNGDVLIMHGKYGHIGSDWDHSGFFDRQAWLVKGATDSCMSVMTAQSNQDGMAAHLKAEHPGNTTYEPLNFYNYGKDVKVIRPKAYTDQKASKAVSLGRKTVEGDHWYNMLWNNCANIIVNSWYDAGCNLDGEISWVPFLLTPDDIDGCTRNKYINIRIYVLWWSWTHKIQTYSATGSVIHHFKR